MSEYDANKYLAASVQPRKRPTPPPIKTFPLARCALAVLGVVAVCLAWGVLL